MRTRALATGIISISISVVFWGLILFTHFAQIGGDSSTAIALGLGWSFLGCPVILTLSIISLVAAFKKSHQAQGVMLPSSTPDMFGPKMVSVISLALLIVPFLIGIFGPTFYNNVL